MKNRNEKSKLYLDDETKLQASIQHPKNISLFDIDRKKLGKGKDNKNLPVKALCHFGRTRRTIKYIRKSEEGDE
jgi:TnpA family transposase